MPPKRTSFRKRDSQRLVSIIPIQEADVEDSDEDVFGSPGDEEVKGPGSINLEELEDAFDHFLYKLDNLVSSNHTLILYLTWRNP